MEHKALLFLNGEYPKEDLSYYKRLCPGKFLVAVDGGYTFFKKTGLNPDLLIGDFDSLGKMPKKLSPSTLVVQFTEQKDKADAELAVDFCLDHKISELIIIQPSFGEPDHFVGNLMLLIRAVRLNKRHEPCSVHIINRNYEVCALADGSGIIRNARGDGLSIVPISDQIKLNLSGTQYDVTNLIIERGDSRALRNTIKSNRMQIRVKGTALVVRRFSKPGRA